MSRYSALTSLQLDGNQLRELPYAIHLTALTKLTLGKNRFSIFPQPIVSLTRLVTLILENNELEQIPGEISYLTGLKILNISRNKLCILPPEIGRLTALEDLNVSDNRLRTLPSQLADLTQLTELILFANDLDELPPSGLAQSIWVDRFFPQRIPPFNEVSQITYEHMVAMASTPTHSLKTILLCMHELNIALGRDIRKDIMTRYNQKHPSIPVEWEEESLDRGYNVDVEGLCEAYIESIITKRA
ncbi:MAG: leucine-rich repeat domain-containing protein [Simkaniaceae bacterium]|nr:leucine-rich repeat domain-containing protein [Simkaniaceae bacterium]